MSILISRSTVINDKLEFSGKSLVLTGSATSKSTLDNDSVKTLVTKDYVDRHISSISQITSISGGKGISVNGTDNVVVNLDVATSSEIGGIYVEKGSGLSLESDGKLSADFDSTNLIKFVGKVNPTQSGTTSDVPELTESDRGSVYVIDTTGKLDYFWSLVVDDMAVGQDVSLGNLLIWKESSFVYIDRENREEFVSKTGDNMTGNLTLNDNKIILNADLGNVNAAGRVDVGSTLQVGSYTDLENQLQESPFEYKIMKSGGVVFKISPHFTPSSQVIMYTLQGATSDLPSTTVYSMTPNGVGFYKGAIRTGISNSPAASFQASSDGQVSMRFFLNVEDFDGTTNNLQYFAEPHGGLYFGDSTESGCGSLMQLNNAEITNKGSATFRGGAVNVYRTPIIDGVPGAGVKNVFVAGTGAYSGTRPVDEYYTNYDEETGKLVPNKDAHVPVSFSNKNHIIMKSNGTATFAGNVSAKEFIINLESDDPTKYVITTDEDEEVDQTYIGETLNITQRLTTMDTALQTLKEQALNATDFTSLREAILTALQNI